MTRSAGIIGAGIAGLACAARLAAAGYAVRLFDKGRRPGGRRTDMGQGLRTSRERTRTARQDREQGAGY